MTDPVADQLAAAAESGHLGAPLYVHPLAVLAFNLTDLVAADDAERLEEGLPTGALAVDCSVDGDTWALTVSARVSATTPPEARTGSFDDWADGPGVDAMDRAAVDLRGALERVARLVDDCAGDTSTQLRGPGPDA